MASVQALRYDPDPCSIGRTLELIGEKWSLLVLREVFSGVRRFDDLQRRIGAPRQVLSARLATLVAAGVLRRHPYQDPGRRTRYEYRLTAAGMDLYPVLVGLLRWGDRYLDQPTGGPSLELTHRDCGEPVDLAVRCRAGHELGSLREVRPVPGPGARLLDPDDPRAVPPTDPRLREGLGLTAKPTGLTAKPTGLTAKPTGLTAKPSGTAVSGAR